MNEIMTMRTDLANQFAAAGAKLLDFTMTAGALAAIPNTMPPQYAVAGTLETINAVLPAAAPSHPQRRLRRGDRPSADDLDWDEAASRATAPHAATDGLTPLDYRAQGREEVLAIILGQSSEDPFADCIGWGSSGAPDDDGGTYWDEDKLRALLHIGDKKHDAYDRAEAAYWDALGHKDEAKREMLLVEQAPFYKPLHEFLTQHEAWDLMGDLKRAAQPVEAAGSAVQAEPSSRLVNIDEVKRLCRDHAYLSDVESALDSLVNPTESFGNVAKAEPFMWVNPEQVQRARLTDYAESDEAAGSSVKFGHFTMPLYASPALPAVGGALVASELPEGWRGVIKRARDSLGAGTFGTEAHNEINYATPIIDGIEEELERLAAGALVGRNDDAE